MRKILIVFAISFLLSSVAATTCANANAQGVAEAGKCCYSWNSAATPPAIAVLKAPGVDTCAANGDTATTNFATQITRNPTACLAGYALIDNSCTICGAGKYSAAGATSCTNCPAGTYSTATGADSVDDCMACDAL